MADISDDPQQQDTSNVADTVADMSAVQPQQVDNPDLAMKTFPDTRGQDWHAMPPEDIAANIGRALKAGHSWDEVSAYVGEVAPSAGGDQVLRDPPAMPERPSLDAIFYRGVAY